MYLAAKKRKINYYKELAEKYFKECDELNKGCEGKIPIVKPYTLSGLLCALGIGRESFHDLGKTREGRLFVEYVLMKIEAVIEENALSGKLSASAAASSLKYSFGWNEKEKDREEEGSIKICLSEEAKRLGE